MAPTPENAPCWHNRHRPLEIWNLLSLSLLTAACVGGGQKPSDNGLPRSCPERALHLAGMDMVGPPTRIKKKRHSGPILANFDHFSKKKKGHF